VSIRLDPTCLELPFYRMERHEADRADWEASVTRTHVTYLWHKTRPYEIQSPLGAGGMGEVYRARDTRLDRTVAIKVLTSHLSSSPELKQRMEREARAISSLNHPRICHLL
jgi:serine/threonine protein kinase